MATVDIDAWLDGTQLSPDKSPEHDGESASTLVDVTDQVIPAPSSSSSNADGAIEVVEIVQDTETKVLTRSYSATDQWQLKNKIEDTALVTLTTSPIDSPVLLIDDKKDICDTLVEPLDSISNQGPMTFVEDNTKNNADEEEEEEKEPTPEELPLTGPSSSPITADNNESSSPHMMSYSPLLQDLDQQQKAADSSSQADSTHQQQQQSAARTIQNLYRHKKAVNDYTQKKQRTETEASETEEGQVLESPQQESTASTIQNLYRHKKAMNAYTQKKEGIETEAPQEVHMEDGNKDDNDDDDDDQKDPIPGVDQGVWQLDGRTNFSALLLMPDKNLLPQGIWEMNEESNISKSMQRKPKIRKNHRKKTQSVAEKTVEKADENTATAETATGADAAMGTDEVGREVKEAGCGTGTGVEMVDKCFQIGGLESADADVQVEAPDQHAAAGVQTDMDQNTAGESADDGDNAQGEGDGDKEEENKEKEEEEEANQEEEEDQNPDFNKDTIDPEKTVTEKPRPVAPAKLREYDGNWMVHWTPHERLFRNHSTAALPPVPITSKWAVDKNTGLPYVSPYGVSSSRKLSRRVMTLPPIPDDAQESQESHGRESSGSAHLRRAHDFRVRKGVGCWNRTKIIKGEQEEEREREKDEAHIIEEKFSLSLRKNHSPGRPARGIEVTYDDFHEKWIKRKEKRAAALRKLKKAQDGLSPSVSQSQRSTIDLAASNEQKGDDSENPAASDQHQPEKPDTDMLDVPDMPPPTSKNVWLSPSPSVVIPTPPVAMPSPPQGGDDSKKKSFTRSFASNQFSKTMHAESFTSKKDTQSPSASGEFVATLDDMSVGGN